MRQHSFLKSEDLFIRLSGQDTQKATQDSNEEGTSSLQTYLDFYEKIGLKSVKELLEFLALYETAFEENSENKDAKGEGHIAQLKANAFSSDTWTKRHPDINWHRLRILRSRISTPVLEQVMEQRPYFVLNYFCKQAKKKIQRRQFWLKIFDFRNQHAKKLIIYRRILESVKHIKINVAKEKQRTEDDLFNRLEIATQMPLPTCDDVLFFQTMTNLSEDRLLRARTTGVTADSLSEAKAALKSDFLNLPSQFSRNMNPERYANSVKLLMSSGNTKTQKALMDLAVFEEQSGSLKTENRIRRNNIVVIPQALSHLIPKRLYLPKTLMRLFFKNTYERYKLFENKQWLMLVMKSMPSILHFLKTHKNAKLYFEEIMGFLKAELKRVENQCSSKKTTSPNKMHQCLEHWQNLLRHTHHQLAMAVEGTFPLESQEDSIPKTQELRPIEKEIEADFQRLHRFGAASQMMMSRMSLLTSSFCVKIQNAPTQTFSVDFAGDILGIWNNMIQTHFCDRWGGAEKSSNFGEAIAWLREYAKIYAVLEKSMLGRKADQFKSEIQSIFRQAILNLLDRILDPLIADIKNAVKFSENHEYEDNIHARKAKLGSCIDLMKQFPWHGCTTIAPDFLYQKLHSLNTKWPIIKAYAQSLYEGVKSEKTTASIVQNHTTFFQSAALDKAPSESNFTTFTQTGASA